MSLARGKLLPHACRAECLAFRSCWLSQAPGSSQATRQARLHSCCQHLYHARQPHLAHRRSCQPCGQLGCSTQPQRRPQHSLSLRSGEVHVWWLNTQEVRDAALLDEYHSLLTSEEQQYVLAAPDTAVRKERLLARVLTRTTLTRYCAGSLTPTSLSFVRSGSGKPQLSWPAEEPCPAPNLHFNLTHTTALLGCAVACDARVGLDVERTDRHTRRDPLKLANRYFTDQEVASLQDLASPSDRAAHFVRLWTLKEAYVKALGCGISGSPGLRGISLQLHRHSPHLEPLGMGANPRGASRPCVQGTQPVMRIEHSRVGQHARGLRGVGDDAEAWRFVLLQPDADHTAALCVERAHAQLTAMPNEQLPVAMLPNGQAGVEHADQHPMQRGIAGSTSADETNARMPLTLKMWRTVPLQSDTPLDVPALIQGTSKL